MRMGALADAPSGKKDNEKGAGGAGEQLGETRGGISTDETR